MSQLSLFEVPPAPARPDEPPGAAEPSADVREFGARLPRSVRLGTSSWAFPGWAGIVYDRKRPEADLSRRGLSAYARHPVLRTVGLDRTFYAPIAAEDFRAYAAQVPDAFRFLVKAPSVATDAVLRDERGRATAVNPGFLDATWTLDRFVSPALDGLGEKAGPLVFQLSPLPRQLLARPEPLLERLRTFLGALRAGAPRALVAVEIRNAELVGEPLARALAEVQAHYCIGIHARMPSVREQARRMAATLSGTLVARWNLHAGYAYEEAKAQYAPFNRMVEPDVETRSALAELAADAIAGGRDAFIIANNKAEGSAPLSMIALAQAIVARMENDTGETTDGDGG